MFEQLDIQKARLDALRPLSPVLQWQGLEHEGREGGRSTRSAKGTKAAKGAETI